MQPTIRGRKPSGQASLTVFRYPSPGITMNWIASHDLARQLQMPEDPQGRWQDLRLLQPAGRREKWSDGNFQTPLFHEGAAGKPAAQRGRPHRQEGRNSGGCEVAEKAGVQPS